MTSKYYNGKLLLFGEYAALFGAKVLAAPSIFGQEFIVSDSIHYFYWKSLDYRQQAWSEIFFDKNLEIINTSNENAALHLQKILRKVVSEFNIGHIKNKQVISKLNYPQKWGLGSSSTMYSFLAELIGVNVYDLFYSIEKGSGFDLACATSDKEIIFERQEIPVYSHVEIDKEIKEKLLFVYTEKKQNSHQSIHKIEREQFSDETLRKISDITEKAISSSDISEWISLMEAHENIISKTLKLEKVKDKCFSDFNGSIKSLGAWGGDFVMAASENSDMENMKNYFIEKGFPIVKTWNEILK